MTLQEITESLPEEKRFQLAIKLIKMTLPIWDEYAMHNELTYRDTVAGLVHSVDKKLIENTIDIVERFIATNKVNRVLIKNINLLALKSQFSDPIIALQDSDWELPYDVELIFNAVHNLLDASLGKEMTLFEERTIYVTINQAIDVLDYSKTLTFEQIKDILAEYNNGK